MRRDDAEERWQRNSCGLGGAIDVTPTRCLALAELGALRAAGKAPHCVDAHAAAIDGELLPLQLGDADYFVCAIGGAGGGVGVGGGEGGTE